MSKTTRAKKRGSDGVESQGGVGGWLGGRLSTRLDWLWMGGVVVINLGVWAVLGARYIPPFVLGYFLLFFGFRNFLLAVYKPILFSRKDIQTIEKLGKLAKPIWGGKIMENAKLADAFVHPLGSGKNAGIFISLFFAGVYGLPSFLAGVVFVVAKVGVPSWYVATVPVVCIVNYLLLFKHREIFGGYCKLLIHDRAYCAMVVGKKPPPRYPSIHLVGRKLAHVLLVGLAIFLWGWAVQVYLKYGGFGAEYYADIPNSADSPRSTGAAILMPFGANFLMVVFCMVALFFRERV